MGGVCEPKRLVFRSHIKEALRKTQVHCVSVFVILFFQSPIILLLGPGFYKHLSVNVNVRRIRSAISLSVLVGLRRLLKTLRQRVQMQVSPVRNGFFIIGPCRLARKFYVIF